ncbi:MAG: serine/threonine protein kinase, partial [bacterium]|nr:serine/threonine protein kinase [bacterium]
MGTQFAPDSRIGKYRIVRELGRGGMGVVYLAEDSVLSRSVAVKVLHPQHSVDPGFAQRFQHEARVVGQFFHPNILPVNSFEAVDGVFLLEMPYLERGSLDGLLRTRGVYAQEIVRWAGDVLAALGHCHDRDLLHRDVKPTNVLLDEDGRALLADFGLAKLTNSHVSESFSSLTSTGLFVGTVRYAPPEAWDGAEPTPAWDLYSTGVVLYEGLTGKPLYEADTPLAYMKEVVERPVRPPREYHTDVSCELDALVMTLLAKQPESRPSSAWEALERLQNTPEHQKEHDASSPTEQIRLSRPKVLSVASAAKSRRLSQSVKLGARTVRRVFPWFGWAAAFVVLLAVVFGKLLATEPNEHVVSTSRVEEPSRISLLDIGGEELPAWDSLLARTRFAPGHACVYRGHTAATDARSERLWVWVESDGVPQVAVLEVQELGMSLLSFRSQGEAGFAIEGRWGRYRNPSALGVMEGTVIGTARRIEGQRVLLAELDYRSESDGFRRHEQIILVPDDRADMVVLVEAERSDLLMPLLYNELGERQHEWRTLASSWFPALKPAQADVLKMPASRSDWVVDGLGTDVAYAIDIGDAKQAVMAGWPSAHRPTLRARWSPDGVLMIFEAQVIELAEPVLDVALLTRYTVPAGNSTRCSIRLQGGKISSFSCSGVGTTHGETPGWQVAEQ